MNRRTAIASVSALALIGSAGLLVAGPLNPPAGPVTSTMKTIAEVEPRIAVNATNTPGDADSVYKITQPGSYYLAGNVATATGKAGIEITASNVTLDLSGFSITGAGVTGDLDGVRASAALSGVTIRNGCVVSTGDDGIDLNSSSVVTIENVRVIGAQVRGISLGARCVVRECSINTCGSHGVWVGADSRVEHCSSIGSAGAHGIVCNGTGVTVTDCTASRNAMSGISADFYDTVENCRCDNNAVNGILVDAGCVVRNNAVSQNGFVGILVDGNGINHIIGNRVNSNGTAGSGAGIRVTASSGTNNNIEDNTVIQNPRGIDLLNGNNLVRRNWVSANTTNYAFIAGNRVAPIAIAPSSSANTPAGLGTTDPNANISY